MSYPGNPVVANISALTRLSLNNGEFAFVLSVQDPWQFVTSGATFTVDHITVEATSLGGATRWVRSFSYNPVWRTLIENVYIDSATGNDENQGIYANAPGSPAPLKTWGELLRRWGHNIVTSGGGGIPTTVVHILNALPSNDGMSLSWICGSNSFFRVLGENTSLLHSGTLDNPGGFTAWVPAAPAGGTPNIIKDSSVATWTPYIGKRIHFTRVNSWAYVLKDLGAGSARISVPQFTDEPDFDGTPINTLPANGDAYNVEDPVIAYLSESNLDGVFNDAATISTQGFVNVSNFTIKSALSSVITPPINSTSNVILQFFQCVFDTRVQNVPTQQNMSLANCRVFGITMTGYLGQTSGLSLNGGAVIRTDGTPGWVQCSGGIGDAGMMDYYTTIQGGLVTLAPSTQVRSFSIFNAGIISGINDNGDAIQFGGSGHHIYPGIVAIVDRGGVPVFGSNSSGGVGLSISPCARATWETLPNVTNTAGDFRVGKGGQERAFDTATGNYTAPIAPSWAALADPAQFNGGVHDPVSDAHLVKAT